jgi:hypothetical protein
MRRVIWAVWFAIGFYALALLVQTLDAWAAAHAMPAADRFCRGHLLVTFDLRYTSTCMANWLSAGRSWFDYAHGVLASADAGHLYLIQVVRVADVLLFGLGALSFGFALACLWANLATQGLMTAVAGLYTLVHGVNRLQQRGRA